MKTMDELYQELTVRRKRTQILYILHGELYLGVFVLAIMQLPIPAIIAGAANLLFYALFLRKETGACNELASQITVRFGLCAPLDEVKYTGRVGISAEQFDALDMLPMVEERKSLMTRKGFAGKGFGQTLKGWEISLPYKTLGANGKPDYQFLTGTLLTGETPSRTGSEDEWLFLRKNLLACEVQEAFANQRGYYPVSCSAEGLTRRFDIYARVENTVLPRKLAESIERLSDASESLGAVRLATGVAAVFLSKRFYTANFRLRDMPNEAGLSRCLLPERDSVWEFFRFWAKDGERDWGAFQGAEGVGR